MRRPKILLLLQLFMPLRFPGSYCRLHIGSRFVLHPDGVIRRASPLVAGARFIQARTAELRKFV
jgi:hypothetical protein